MISLLLIIFAGFLNSVMDVLFTRYDRSIFKGLNSDWWDPRRSWKRKWVLPLEPATKKWYYFGMDPEWKERFPFSTTSLVWITDGWHLAKALMLLSIMSSVVLYETIWSTWIDILIYYLAWTVTFTLFYTKILIKR